MICFQQLQKTFASDLSWSLVLGTVPCVCVCCALGRCSSSEELHELPFPDSGLKGCQRLRVLGAAPFAGPGSSSTAGDDGAELGQDSEILCSWCRS